MRVVVAGASLGGLRAAEQLRAAGFSGELVVVGDEPHLPYNRPPLSKEALAGGVTREGLEFRRRKSVSDVTWRLGTPVVSSSLEDRVLRLGDGEELGYDGLVVATGVRARRVPLAGPADGRHVVRTLSDAEGLRAELRAGARVVVIGGGFIGCEVASTARGLACEVDVVAPEPVPMQRPLGLDLGAALQRRHEAQGTRFHLQRTIERFSGDDRVSAVHLDGGEVLPADVVVEAVGCAPNVEWLDGNGLDLSDGVLCDSWLRVEGRADAVAVGDVARFPNALFDDVPRRVEHWNMPTETAKRAAAGLVAGLGGQVLPDEPFAPVPAFWSDQCGVRLQSFGTTALGPDVEVLQGDLEDRVIVGYFAEGRLMGVVAVDMTSEVVPYRGLIGSALPAPV